MPMDVAAISYLLSSAASTAKIIEFAIGLTRKATPAEVAAAKREAELYGSTKARSISKSSAAMGQRMSEHIEKSFRKKISGIYDLVDKILSDENIDLVEQQQRLQQARRNYCFYLNEWKDWNGGKLPTDLEEEWNKFNCSGYTYY